MATLRELKGRIGSVASSEKITGAMKMISSAKMHKAEGSLRRLVPFKDQIRTIMANLLSSDADFASPLTANRPDVRNITIVVWGSDDGLCGAYNVNIFKNMLTHINDLRTAHPDATMTIIAVGKKMYKATAKIADGKTITVQQAPIDSKAAGKSVDQFMLSLQNDFATGHTDRVDALYMHFKTAGKQIFNADRILPVQSSTFNNGDNKKSERPYLFEPDPNTIFNAVLPMFLLSDMQQIFIENRASEQAARVMAMQSANDNAKKLLEQLNLEYNKLRQQSITNELLDILGGQTRE